MAWREGWMQSGGRPGGAWAVLGLLVALHTGCEDTATPSQAGVGATGGAPLGGQTGLGGAGAVGATGVGADGGSPPDQAAVLIGLETSAADAPQATPAQALEATLSGFSTGARVLVAGSTWRAFDPQDLEASAALVGSEGKRLVWTLDVVDRAADGRPDDLALLEWDDAAVEAELLEAVGSAIDAADGELFALVLARDADVFASQNPRDQAALASLLDAAATAALAHPGAPDDLLVGVGVTAGGLLEAPLSPLVGIGNTTVVSFVPHLQGTAAEPIGGQLDALIDRSGSAPILLLGVGAPSQGNGNDEASQRAFFESFFDALEQRREQLPYVSFRELYDRSEASCEALVLAQGENPEFSDVRCSLGLISADGQKKQAFDEFLRGASTFVEP